jgi:hypothetical protein
MLIVVHQQQHWQWAEIRANHRGGDEKTDCSVGVSGKLKGDFQNHLVLGNLTIVIDVATDFLNLEPGDLLEGFMGTTDSRLDRSLDTRRRNANDFDLFIDPIFTVGHDHLHISKIP